MSGPVLAKIIGFNTDDGALNSPVIVMNKKNGNKGLMVDIDMLKTTFTEEYSTSQTATAIITPTTGYRLCIRTVEIVTAANTGEVQLDFLTSSKKVSRLYASAQNKNVSNTSHLVGAIDEVLSLTTTTLTSKVFLVITYVEHK